ncbi:hypothetical protein Taro_014415 [Colocasia esculenta]|uniref:non-specific serine/threonine protein kinase n=1 Tax=Colocasia esculenta TaxID=4460 RepID=A0A843U8Z5_COLES|nr:hypothetical protein [Colocasia esculenta]
MRALPFLLLCFPLFLCSAGSSEPVAADREALLGLKRSVADDPLQLLSGWQPAASSHCGWYGVTCDEVSGRVTALNLAGREPAAELVGTLADSVGKLTQLRVLSLRCNAFSGAIPAEAFGRLRLLEVLELQSNNFSWSIPAQISGLPSLRVLRLSYNSFSGAIPENLIGHSTLQVLDLSHNQLSGKIRVGPVGSCRSLVSLRLSDNFLVDMIPAEIGNCRSLRFLLLDGNILEGYIPGEVGRLSELRVLDVSRNSLTDRIPAAIGNCKKLSVLILTNVVDGAAPISEFNAFVGSIPSEVLLLPSLTILWAPRANLGGQLPINWNSSCGLRILNLGQNYIMGSIPEQLGMCRNLSFLDLSSNELQGSFPVQIQAGCMAYLNVSRNSLDGLLEGYRRPSCPIDMNVDGEDSGLSRQEDLEKLYSRNFLRSSGLSNPFGPFSDDDFVVLHDFSFNKFNGSLPSFLLLSDQQISFGLFLNNNSFTGSISAVFEACKDLQSFQIDLSSNQVSGHISASALAACREMKRLEAAYNQLSGPIPSAIGDLVILSHLDLRGNHLNGFVPQELGKLKSVEQVLLNGNSLTGEIPWQLGEMASLMVLDLSKNALTGTIPSSLANVTNLQVLLLNHNHLSGSIPMSFSNLTELTTLDVSFNNLSGHIPSLRHLRDCSPFRGNTFLQPCPDPDATSQSEQSSEFHHQMGQQDSGLKSYVIATVASASLTVSLLIVLVLFVAFSRKKTAARANSRGDMIVTFADAPAELNYENLLKATGNFSIRNLIGMGGFGSTYKAELLPGFLVAVKRLSIGRFQGLQQFDAEIRTLGRIRHKNLVTLLGYHMGEEDKFLIYNYLSGGNLEAFIHDRSGKNARWSVIHKISLDVAQALAYLHYSCVPRIVHRDIKPSNILLDEKLNAYLSDFGLARLLEVTETHATTDVAGTFGYVAPEYASTCRVSDKADVYSFGVVLLELMSGKRSLDPSFSEYGDGFNIVAWGKMMIKEERHSEIFSRPLWEAGPRDNLVSMLKLASDCTVESLSVRPSMKQVVDKLKKLKNYL